MYALYYSKISFMIQQKHTFSMISIFCFRKLTYAIVQSYIVIHIYRNCGCFLFTIRNVCMLKHIFISYIIYFSAILQIQKSQRQWNKKALKFIYKLVIILGSTHTPTITLEISCPQHSVLLKMIYIKYIQYMYIHITQYSICVETIVLMCRYT